MITRRNNFISFRQQEDRRNMTRFRIFDAVEISRDLQCDWARQQPEVPPSEAAQDHFSQRHRIMQNQSRHWALRCYMKRRGSTDACAIRHDRAIDCVTFQFIECCKRRWPDPRQSRWPRAVAESRIIHSPDFNGALIPHLCLGGYPAIRAIGIAIETQNENVCAALLLRATRLSCPDFQLAILKRNCFAHCAACIDRRSRWEQNQMIRQMTENHDGRIYDGDCERNYKADDLGHPALRWPDLRQRSGQSPSSFSSDLICSRNSGVFSCPWAETACCTAASSTSCSVPEILSEQFFSLG